MPQSIPPGLTREHVLRTLADLDEGLSHPFGPPTGYELVHDGKRYAPKAVVGLACRYLLGRVLQPQEFSGGEAPGQANYMLRKLGFTVVQKGEESEEPAGRDWSEAEVRLIVADYFDMLSKELLGQPLNKTEHRNALSPRLNTRSKGSIEFKHQNISAVLVDRGLPYIEGYKPRGNFQALLAEAVDDFLDQDPNYLEQMAKGPAVNPGQPPKLILPNLDLIIEAPPDRIIAPRSDSKLWLSRRGIRLDFAERDAANRRLSKLGEQFVVDIERHRLLNLGRDDLAKRVDWVAQTIGDGLGFDVLSFSEIDDSELLIEVKTTGLGKYFPFYVTANELRCSEDMGSQFNLFRVFDFSRQPRLYVLPGSLRTNCQLEPIQYRATIGA